MNYAFRVFVLAAVLVSSPALAQSAPSPCQLEYRGQDLKLADLKPTRATTATDLITFFFENKEIVVFEDLKRACKKEEVISKVIQLNGRDTFGPTDVVKLPALALVATPPPVPTPTATPVATFVSQPVVQPVPAAVAEAKRELPKVKQKIVVVTERRAAVATAVGLRPDAVGASPAESQLLAKLETEIATLKARKDNYQDVLTAYAKHLKAIDGNLATQTRWNKAQDRSFAALSGRFAAFQKQQAQTDATQDGRIAALEQRPATDGQMAASVVGRSWWDYLFPLMVVLGMAGLAWRIFTKASKTEVADIDRALQRQADIELPPNLEGTLNSLEIGKDIDIPVTYNGEAGAINFKKHNSTQVKTNQIDGQTQPMNIARLASTLKRHLGRGRVHLNAVG